MDQVNQELIQYAELSMRIVPAVLAIVLASLTVKLAGKGWLIAAVVINFVTMVGYSTVNALLHHGVFHYDVAPRWYALLNLVGVLGIFSFGIFIFSNYIASRMTLNVNDLLFSFSGRIPRSAFWIWACIAYPCGALIGFPIFAMLTEPGNGFTIRPGIHHLGLPVIVFLVLYACCCILSTWMTLAVYAKRWHDCSKSGWMTLVVFLPIIGLFWLIGYLGFVRGTYGSNEYGDDPIALQPDSATTPPIPLQSS
jgi:uncharacterized membrane protein YhaH (DUF805 family)